MVLMDDKMIFRHHRKIKFCQIVLWKCDWKNIMKKNMRNAEDNSTGESKDAKDPTAVSCSTIPRHAIISFIVKETPSKPAGALFTECGSAFNLITRRSFNRNVTRPWLGQDQARSARLTHTCRTEGMKKTRMGTCTKNASKRWQCHHKEPMECPVCEIKRVDDVVGTVAMATELLQHLKWMSWQRAEELAEKWKEVCGWGGYSVSTPVYSASGREQTGTQCEERHQPLRCHRAEDVGVRFGENAKQLRVRG